MREDWVETELGRVCDIISGKNQKNVENQNGQYPIYGSGGIFGYADEYLCEPGTTIIGRKGTINSPILVNQKFWNVDTAFGISPKVFINAKYVYYFCVGFNFKKLDKSTTIPSLAKRDLLKIGLPLAPLPEQRAIVAKIEKLFSDLDNGIANLKAAKAKLDIYRAAVLHYAFENQGFESIRLEEVVEDHMIGIVRSGKDQNNAGKGVPYIKMNNVDLNGNVNLGDVVYVEVDDNELKKYRLNNDDILINTRNSYELVGKTGIVKNIKSDFVFNNNLLRIRVKKGNNASFVAYQLVSPLVRNQMREGKNATTNVCALYQRNIFPLKIKLAQLNKQNLIVAAIESRLSVCDKLAESIDQSLEKSEALRQSILKKAFAGNLLSQAELEACRQEPDWEPATKLLERIKKEESSRSAKKQVKNR